MLSLKNEAGAMLNLFKNPFFRVSNIDGLTTYAGNLASSSSAYADGDEVTNAQAQPRSIVIDLTLADGANVQAAIDEITAVVKPKKEISLIWKTAKIEKSINGVVEGIDAPRVTNDGVIIVQISLHCGFPWWEDAKSIITEIAEALPLFYLRNGFLIDSEGKAEKKPLGEIDLNKTKAFNNDGAVAVGMDISIVAVGTVVNPSLRRDNGDFIGFNLTMNAGDEIKISTHTGNKSITLNGSNAMNKITRGSSLMQLEVGEQQFTIAADEGVSYCYFTIAFKKLYL